MIIKLNGADFSANNLGQVQVTTELNAFTKSAIAASGNDSLTKEQKSALDALFLAMGVDGSNTVMSKMRKVYLPMIAGDVSKALVNYADANFAVDVELSDTYWELRNNGLVGKSSSGQAISMTLDDPIVASNFTQLWLRTELMVAGTNDSGYVCEVRGKTNTSLWLGAREASESSDNRIGWGTYGANWGNVGAKADLGIKTAGILALSAAQMYANIYGTWDNNFTKAITSDLSSETSETLYVLGAGNQNTNKAYGAIVFGEAISYAEAQAVASAIDALYDTLK